MSSTTSHPPVEEAHSVMPPAARMAILLVAAFGLACLAIAIQRRGSWDDLVFFGLLTALAANVVRSLAIRDRWAWTACCWIGVIATVNFGLLGTAIGVWLAVEAAGFGPGTLEVTPAKVTFWVAWMALLVMIPAGVSYALTRPPVRAWFSAEPAG